MSNKEDKPKYVPFEDMLPKIIYPSQDKQPTPSEQPAKPSSGQGGFDWSDGTFTYV